MGIASDNIMEHLNKEIERRMKIMDHSQKEGLLPSPGFHLVENGIGLEKKP
ncbi:MAG: hypothetical protein PHU81_03300 [Acidobacteriota bacterium]|nr:hypothetical protein [Acidobacteriota bacterium]